MGFLTLKPLALLRRARFVEACTLMLLWIAVSTSTAVAQTDAGGGNAAAGAGGGTGGFESSFNTEPSLAETAFSQDGQENSNLGRAADLGTGQAGAAGGGRAAGGFGGGGLGGLGGFGGLGGLFGNAFGGANAGSGSQSPIRTRLRSAVRVQARPAPLVQQSASRALRRLPATSDFPNVQVRMEGRTAVITGTTTSEKTRRMSELLLRLEPGVSRVQNEIRVEPNLSPSDNTPAPYQVPAPVPVIEPLAPVR